MGEKDFMGQPISPDAPASSAAERVSDVPPGRPPNWPLQSFDARDWGAEFCRIGRARGLDLDDEDESWIVGWFANALMKGWDEQRRRTDAEAARPRVETTPAGATVDTPDNDLATLTRERDEARAEVAGWRECVLYDAMMEGPRFKGWNRSALDRMRRRAEQDLACQPIPPSTPVSSTAAPVSDAAAEPKRSE